MEFESWKCRVYFQNCGFVQEWEHFMILKIFDVYSNIVSNMHSRFLNQILDNFKLRSIWILPTDVKEKSRHFLYFFAPKIDFRPDCRRTKRISSEEQLQIFLKSETYTTLMSFISALGDSVVGKPLSFECEVSENVQKISNLL